MTTLQTLAHILAAVAALAPSALGHRTNAGSVARHDAALEARSHLEAQAAGRTRAMFEEAFTEEERAAAGSSCPYGDKAASLVGGKSSFTCHHHLPAEQGRGSTCPDLQAKRLVIARQFTAGAYGRFMDAAKNFTMRPLFDKSDLILGDETYEHMVRYHIDGLLNPDIALIEDKILLKGLAGKLGVPTTTMYFGAHKSDWHAETFASNMMALCDQGVDAMIIKATHLAWSGGMKIVRGWLQKCRDPNEMAKLVTFIEEEVLGQLASEADKHLREYLEPGVTVEELFKTGGASMQPLEAKVQLVWGRVHQIFFIGQDARGCNVGSGAWMIYGDKTGWAMDGPLSDAADASARAFMEKFYDRVVAYAEAFAAGIGADFTRADFFLAGMEDDQEPVIKLNEGETVSGLKYVHERVGLGDVWRDGYVVSNRFRMTPERWEVYMGRVQNDRDAFGLD